MNGARVKAAIAVTAAIAAGCGGGERTSPPPPSSAPAERASAGGSGVAHEADESGAIVVEMLDLRFSPLRMTVQPRERVTFVNAGEVTHNAKGAGFFTRVVEPGDEKTVRVPRQPGRHRYVCTFHLGMEATLTVRG